MLPAQITRNNIGSVPLALTVRGITTRLVDKQVLHSVHCGAAFVIAHPDADTTATVEQLSERMPTFVIKLDSRTLNALSSGRSPEAAAVVADTAGEAILGVVRVHNQKARPLTATGRSEATLILASDLEEGDLFCDGTTVSDTDRAWEVSRADADTAGKYLPGRLVYRLAPQRSPRGR